ncbi:PREDICTED: UDP-glycosyltransferase 84B2-like [Tarenaya hassleriana]|uniref:UDP-glycosyltransferase 84B2-like n=1 Tax=Tarenaya hassleriana TaxID=28532 RepID=UPI00053C7C5B|nr:PREDICTED: UDP-glycosyltransferase 84B2-like [Tarenaya hassleriana]
MALNSKTSDVQIHVLMVAFAAQGHINPLLRFARRLLPKGIHVALATTETAKRRMLASETAIANADNTAVIAGFDVFFFSDGFGSDFDRKANMDHYVENFGSFASVSLSNIIEEHYLSKNKKLSCIVSNPFVSFAVDVADKYDIPSALLWIQPCALFSTYYHYFNDLNEFPADSDVVIPGLPRLRRQDLPSFVVNSSGGLSKLFRCVFQNMKKYKWVFANSFVELEKEAIDAMNNVFPVQPVGPLISPSLRNQEQTTLDSQIEMWKPDETCLEWLDKQEPSSVIYVSFGSILELSAKQMEEIATALKNLKAPFIWVVKKPEFPSEDRKGELPLGFLEETKDQGIVVSWSPQTKVLAHPSTGCFVTHCGWNSLLETIAAGVPVVAYPQWTDQPTNAKMIEEVFKMGVRVNPREDGLLGHEELERCIGDVMFGPKSELLKRRCLELKLATKTAVSDGGSSDNNIQMFVDEIIAGS